MAFPAATGADLQGAQLEEANLQGANLQGTDLEGAHLQGVAMTRVLGLTREQLDLALVDAETLLPFESQKSNGTEIPDATQF